MLNYLLARSRRGFWSWQNIIQILILALLYFLAGKASFSVSVSHRIVTLVVFVSEGFALAATILFGERICLGVFFGQLFLAIDNGLAWQLAIGVSLVNSCEAVIGARLFHKFRLHPNLDRIQDVGGLHLLIFGVLQPFGATLGTIILSLGGVLPISEYASVWFFWWFGNSLGQILVTPGLLSIFGLLSKQNYNLQPAIAKDTKIKEKLGLFLRASLALLLVTIATWLTFNLPGLGNISTAFAILMPLLVLIAVWQGMATVTLAVLLVTALALKATSEYLGPFVINDKFYLLDINVFLLGIILTSQYVAILFAERQQAEARLKLSASVFESTDEGIIILNSAGSIIEVNSAFRKIASCKKEEVIGRNLNWILAEQEEQDFAYILWNSVKKRGFWRGEVFIRSQSAPNFPHLLTVSSVRNANQQITYYVALFADITQLKHQEEKLRQLALFDRLTGLPNRILLFDRLQQEIHNTLRNQTIVAVCYIDLDGFKQVNDTLGHQAGDRLLIEIANRFQACLRQTDTVSRIGGDEFVILMPLLKSTTQAETVLERILETASKPLLIEQQTATVSASIGVTFYPQDNSNIETLLRHADEAMYHAKTMGKGRYCLFDNQ